MGDLSPAMHTAIGGFAGVIEVLINQPLVGWKNAVQDGRPIPRRAPDLYRGVTVNALAYGPITAVQFGVNRAVEKLIVPAEVVEVSEAHKMVSAMSAGALSAFITAPAEMIMIHQQRAGTTLMDQISILLRSHGASVFARGFELKMMRAERTGTGGKGEAVQSGGPPGGEEIFTAMRDTVHCGGYLGLSPILYSTFKNSETFKDNQGSAFALAGTSAGMVVGVTTHPLDTLKTRFQANLGPEAKDKGYGNMRATLRTVYSEGGVPAMYAGFVPRMIRLAVAMNILAGIKNYLTDAAETFLVV